jgi:hypothetical protein
LNEERPSPTANPKFTWMLELSARFHRSHHKNLSMSNYEYAQEKKKKQSLSRETEDTKTQREFLELENAITKVKISLDGLENKWRRQRK